MSSLSQVQVETVVSISKHENADTLELIHLSNGFTVVDRIGKFKAQERIAWCPVDMECTDIENPDYAFLAPEKWRVKGKKIRGVISCGLALKLKDPLSKEGDDLSESYGFVPYGQSEEEIEEYGVKPPIQTSKYDIDSLRKYWRLFEPEIVVTEKIHGANSAFLYNSADDTFYIKTRTRWLLHDDKSMWSKAAKAFDLEAKCRELPDLMICGEVFGNVQDLKYGSTKGELFFAAFDVYKPEWNKFLNHDEVVHICSSKEIPLVPELYRGKWISYEHIQTMAERNTIAGKDHTQIAEGVVVKPTSEMWLPGIGRVILKYPSEQYLTRKQK